MLTLTKIRVICLTDIRNIDEEYKNKWLLQCSCLERKGWICMAEGSKPMLFDTEKEARKKVTELKIKYQLPLNKKEQEQINKGL